LRTDVPPATMLATFAEALYVRLLITDERRDDEFVEDVIAAGLEGALLRVTIRAATVAGDLSCCARW
jgi:hypothetical protein